MAEAQAQSGNGLGIASLVLGILGFMLGFIGVGLLLGIVAIILGIVAIRKKSGKGLAIAGIVTGALGVVSGLIFIVALTALPVLQQNTRDLVRKQDVVSVSSGIALFKSNHQGVLPTDEEITSSTFAQTYFSVITDEVVVSGEPTQDTILYSRGVNCPDEGSVQSARNFALQIKLENGTTYCQSI